MRSEDFGGQPGSAVGGGQQIVASEGDDGLSVIVATIRQFGADRRFLIKSKNRFINGVSGKLRTALGWRNGMDGDETAAIAKRAAAVVKAVEKSEKPKRKSKTSGGGDQLDSARKGRARPAPADPMAALPDEDRAIGERMRPVIMAAVQMRAFPEHALHLIEREMERLSRLLPVYPWAKAINGLGDKGLAIIVAETTTIDAEDGTIRHLSHYPTHSHVWKRLGLAVIDGRRQGRPGKNASKDQWKAEGFVPQRRAEMWTLADALFRAQSARHDDETGQETKPPEFYRLVYDRKKADYMARVEAGMLDAEGKPWTKAHAHNAAVRYMWKRLIRDLWKAWRAASCSLPA